MCPPARDSTPDCDRSRRTKLGHAVQHPAGKSGLDDLGIGPTRSHPITKDRLVSKERVLDPCLTMVTRLLLPLPPTDFTDPAYCSISGWRSGTSDTRRLDRWDDDTCTAVSRSRVDRPRVVGGVADDALMSPAT